MHFVRLQGVLVNLAEIETIVDQPGSTAMLTFRGGRTQKVTDEIVKEIVAILQKKGMILN